MMGYLENTKPTKIETTQSKSVKIITLDKIIKKINSDIKMLKIDIEGSEFLALKGAEQSLKNGLDISDNLLKKVMIMSFHSIRDINLMQL